MVRMTVYILGNKFIITFITFTTFIIYYYVYYVHYAKRVVHYPTLPSAAA